MRLLSDSTAHRQKDFSGSWRFGSALPERPGGRAPGGCALYGAKDKKFIPHVLVIETGTTVDFPNLDPIFHNAFSNFNGQIFEPGAVSARTSQSVRFRRSGIVRVFCNIFIL